MTLEEWEKDNAAFLIKIGQTAPAAPKPAKERRGINDGSISKQRGSSNC